VFAFNEHVKVGPLGITWSLAIEEQFYLLWPLLLILLLKLKTRRRTVLLLVALAIAVTALNRKILMEGGARIERMYYATDTRADALISWLPRCASCFSWNVATTSMMMFRGLMKILAILGCLYDSYLGSHDDITKIALPLRGRVYTCLACQWSGS
jgi:peptidoglycan/LPS O-acetylase OafA/YrhL